MFFNKIKNNIINNKVLFIILFIVLLFLGNMVRLEYSRCTYRMYSKPYIEEYNHYITIGRYFVAIFWKIVNQLSLTLTQTYFISYVLGIISLTLSIFLLYKILLKFIENKYLNLLISIGIILNCFFIDYFMYIEKGVLTLSILFSVFAFKYILHFFEDRKKKNLLYTFIFLLLSSFAYQGTVALFISLSVIFIIKYSKSIKEFICNNLYVISLYGIVMGISYLFVRLLGNQASSRTTGKIFLFENIKKIIKGFLKICRDTYGIMPKYLYIIVILFVVGFVFYIFLKSNDNKYKKKVIWGYIYCFSACIFTIVFPQLFLDTAAVNITARVAYPFGSIVALSILYLLVNSKAVYPKGFKILSIILLILLCIQCYEYNKIIMDHYTLNYIEKNVALSIGEEINRYEESNNSTITKVVFYSDKDSTYNFKDLKGYDSINERVFKTIWCRIDILNYFLNRSFQQAYDINENYKNYFDNIDYKTFNIDQLKFEGDTLHLCVY